MDNKLGDLVREKRGDLSLREFAGRMGISHTHLDSIEKGYDPRTGKPVRITLDTLAKVATGVGLPLPDIIALTPEGEIMCIEAKPTPNKQPKDLKKFLEQSSIMFDGVPLTDDDKEKIRAALEVVFWDAKNQNKRKK